MDVAAAITADRKALTVAVVNPTESAQELDATFAGVSLQGTGRLWRIAPAGLTVQNQIGKPMAVDIVESAVTEAPQRLTIPPISMSIYELELR